MTVPKGLNFDIMPQQSKSSFPSFPQSDPASLCHWLWLESLFPLSFLTLSCLTCKLKMLIDWSLCTNTFQSGHFWFGVLSGQWAQPDSSTHWKFVYSYLGSTSKFHYDPFKAAMFRNVTYWGLVPQNDLWCWYFISCSSVASVIILGY